MYSRMIFVSIFILLITQFSVRSFSQDKVFQCVSPETTMVPIKTIVIDSQLSLKRKQIILYDNAAFPERLSYCQQFEIYRNDSLTLLQTISDSGDYLHNDELIDINSDGHNDLRIEGDVYQLLEPSNYWLYNPERECFKYSEELSGMSGSSVEDDGTISSQDLSTGGRGGEWDKFKFINGKMVLVENNEMDGVLVDSIIIVTSKKTYL